MYLDLGFDLGLHLRPEFVHGCADLLIDRHLATDDLETHRQRVRRLGPRDRSDRGLPSGPGSTGACRAAGGMTVSPLYSYSTRSRSGST